MTGWARIISLLTVIAGHGAAAFSQTPAERLYAEHCVSCHGVDRLGGMGPALLPSNLERLRPAAASKTIAEGRVATQMAAFGDKLSAADIKLLTDYIYTPPAKTPAWGLAEIRASRVQQSDPATLADKPAFKADPLNLFIVVEGGDHHITILDGDRFEPITRFPSRYALHGGPKFSPNGRFVYFASRDGWISKYDLWNLKMIAEVRAGINTRNAAVSSDGKFVAVANYFPHSLVLLDADLNVLKVLPVTDGAGGKSSRVSAVYDAGPRRSFVAALKDIPEVWEVSYDPRAPDIPVGLVHDFQYREGTFIPGYLNPRRTRLDDYLDDFFFTQNYREIIGASRNEKGEGGNAQVIQLDVRRRIATLDLPGLPHLGSGITWSWRGRTVLATPNLKDGLVTVIDIKDWKTVRQIPTLGPGFFMRSHEKSRFAWVDSMMSPRKDTLQVIDKDTLEVVKQLTPVPGKTLAHIEFTRDGRHALASLWEDNGAIIVFDAQTFAEVKRIPMSKPVGKYNVWNKISRSEGTSH